MTTARTAFFARLLGLWIVLTVLSLFANRNSSMEAIAAIFRDPALAFITGVFTLVIGLTIVLLHNRWSGGVLPVVVTLYGWIAAIKGLAFLCLPAGVEARVFAAMHFEQTLYVYLTIALLVGAYLIYAGFRTSS
jgi:vacuolar-type H+-ATPase subunit I/STV1